MPRIQFIFVTSFILFLSCNLGQSQQAKPEKVYRIVYEWKSNEWYQEQAQLWKQEIERDPTNPDAWYNYYNANRYAYFEDFATEEKQRILNKIIEDMGQAIPETYEYYLLKYWNTYDIHDITLIKKAYELQPQRPDSYYPFITHYEIKGQKDYLNEFCQKLYDSKDIAPWLLNYNYNVLMSTEGDAILFTNGDNDTYPVWLLQNTHGIRTDVTVLNISLAATEEYLKRKLKALDISLDITELKRRAKAQETGEFSKTRFVQELAKELLETYPNIPIYFALTVYQDVIKSMREDLYIVGLAYQYTDKRIDNLALIKKNLERNFRLDYLEHDWYQEQYSGNKIKNSMHMNYVIPMVMLADHYQMSAEKIKSKEWSELALRLARDAGNTKSLEELRKYDYN